MVHGEVVGGARERAEGGEEADDVFFEVSAAGALAESVDETADADVGGDDYGGQYRLRLFPLKENVLSSRVFHCFEKCDC